VKVVPSISTPTSKAAASRISPLDLCRSLATAHVTLVMLLPSFWYWSLRLPIAQMVHISVNSCSLNQSVECCLLYTMSPTNMLREFEVLDGAD
jgi:hypothetical protein